MEKVFVITLPFFALIGCGYLAGWKKIVPEAGIAGINTFVFYFALPSLLFRTMATRPLGEILDLTFMGAYATATLAVFALGGVAARLLFSTGLGGSALVGLSGCYSNIGYLGLPLLIALLGEEVGVPVALVLAVDLVVSMSIAIVFLEAGREHDGNGLSGLKKIVKGVALNPLALAIAGGILVSALDWGLFAPLDTFTRILGAAAGPSALFALGASLVGRPISSGFRMVSLMTFLKLVIHPIAVWVVMTQMFSIEPLWAASAVLVAGLPVAGTVFVLSQRYDVLVARVSTSILITTIVAVATFSALLAMLGY